MDLRPVLHIIGILLIILSLSMSLPMLADLYTGSPDWKVFLLGMVVTAFFGGAFILSNTSREFEISLHQAFLLTFLSWFFIALFGALPFRFSELDMGFTDSFFESMSGVTTTGATVITDLEQAPYGILLWRAILQWLGGIGIVLLTISVLPFLKVGGMQVFRTDVSESERALPRVAELAKSIGMIYAALTVACMAFYMAAGMPPFHALCHAMTTISTGGFSTFNDSLGHFDKPFLEMTSVVFMVLGALPFVLYLKAVRGNTSPLLHDEQVRWFLSIIFLSVCTMVLYLSFYHSETIGSALRKSLFNTVSIITGTGYVSSDYSAWGGLAISLFFFMAVVGGCAGSTSCGIKVFRFQILYSIARTQIRKLLYPNGVFISHYNGKPMAKGVSTAVMGFFFLYATCFATVTVMLSFVGLDFITAMSGAVTTLSNVGPGLGDIIGPESTFESLPQSAKWIMSAAMLTGRLEIFPVLVLFSSHLWQR